MNENHVHDLCFSYNLRWDLFNAVTIAFSSSLTIPTHLPTSQVLIASYSIWSAKAESVWNGNLLPPLINFLGRPLFLVVVVANPWVSSLLWLKVASSLRAQVVLNNSMKASSLGLILRVSIGVSTLSSQFFSTLMFSYKCFGIMFPVPWSWCSKGEALCI